MSTEQDQKEPATACAHSSPACDACMKRFDFRVRRAIKELRKQVAKDSAGSESGS